MMFLTITFIAVHTRTVSTGYPKAKRDKLGLRVADIYAAFACRKGETGEREARTRDLGAGGQGMTIIGNFIHVIVR